MKSKDHSQIAYIASVSMLLLGFFILATGSLEAFMGYVGGVLITLYIGYHMSIAGIKRVFEIVTEDESVE